ncbi:AAA family ATPase [Lignipirellula cremea]|uniref:ATP-dependent Clp protease ATP-binding subunit ClpE n=1 Tax=Lignipirellula cremea TaxID=2528010 RepID=A0A518DTC7_9BACT|nr:AAA family ATPase [Lignipirellula cremea]QDU95097.1 ATP-dependent Clp protease ATP-binding subunit ClpE [Lignipirellula cremea]
MKFSTPILVETRRDPDMPGPMHLVRPVFFPQYLMVDRELSKATSQLVKHLSEYLRALSRSGDHRTAARFTFHPTLQLDRCDLRIDLQHHTVRGAFPVVSFRDLNRRVALLPTLELPWFEVERGSTVEQRAQEELTRYFRQVEKDEDADYLRDLTEPFSRKGQAWLDTLEFDVSTLQSFASLRKQENPFAALGGETQFDGETELHNVGRCLDWLYPDQLHRFLRREELTQRFIELMQAPDKRPVLLVGPSQVGKTALVEEFVYRRAEHRGGGHRSRRNVWLLSPQRLISGMSHVGQWESRLLAILKTSRNHDHILYFDDLVGLYRAGVSASSTLSAADVLKPYIERREIRMLGEITPAALRVLRERDRGFADLFHLLPVEEPTETENLQILIETVRRLEQRESCRFALDTLPTVVDLSRRYLRDAAMPGKAASLLEQLAVKFARKSAGRQTALEEFHLKSGLDVHLLDTRQQLARETITQALSQEIIGQPEALETLADVVCIAKARLNDPSRPLGSLLFVGPTGVGKTQSAKALARYLFGDASRLLRFDMNEFVAPGSARRLIGGFDSPEGLLTSAVRRQPFAVLLLDEIEKAHADVFDMLLQVLGEGRLTDALGRTADFTNTVIIMTSNLGARAAASQIGFEGSANDARRVYVKAAEDFFRPEFFNRLDRITTFARLDRDALKKIARLMIENVISRDGLTRRRTALAIDEGAVEWIMDRGYQPQLGARAMRRAIERELVRPVAWRLAGIAPSDPIALRVWRTGDQLNVDVATLQNAQPLPGAERPSLTEDPAGVIRTALESLQRIDGECHEQRPPGELSSGNIGPEQYQYLTLIEFTEQVRRFARQLQAILEERTDRGGRPMIAPRQARRRSIPRSSHDFQDFETGDVFAAQDLNTYVDEAAARNPHDDRHSLASRLRQLLSGVAVVQALAPQGPWRNPRVLAILRGLSLARRDQTRLFAETLKYHFQFSAPEFDNDDPAVAGLDGRLRSLPPGDWKQLPDTLSTPAFVEAHRLGLEVVELEGPAADQLVPLEAGTHLFLESSGRLSPLQIVCWPLRDGEDTSAGLQRFMDAWRLSRSTPGDEDDPFRWGEIIRVYRTSRDGRGSVEDLRSSTNLPHAFRVSDGAVLLSQSLPLPPEFTAAAGDDPSAP